MITWPRCSIEWHSTVISRRVPPPVASTVSTARIAPPVRVIAEVTLDSDPRSCGSSTRMVSENWAEVVATSRNYLR